MLYVGSFISWFCMLFITYFLDLVMRESNCTSNYISHTHIHTYLVIILDDCLLSRHFHCNTNYAQWVSLSPCLLPLPCQMLLSDQSLLTAFV